MSMGNGLVLVLVFEAFFVQRRGIVKSFVCFGFVVVLFFCIAFNDDKAL
jgi:hypothetical protein